MGVCCSIYYNTLPLAELDPPTDSEGISTADGKSRTLVLYCKALLQFCGSLWLVLWFVVNK